MPLLFGLLLLLLPAVSLLLNALLALLGLLGKLSVEVELGRLLLLLMMALLLMALPVVARLGRGLRELAFASTPSASAVARRDTTAAVVTVPADDGCGGAEELG